MTVRLDSAGNVSIEVWYVLCRTFWDNIFIFIVSYQSSLLGLVVWCLTDAVQLLCAGLLAPFTLHTDVVVHLLGLLLCDADALPVIPVGTQVAANVEPLERKRIQRWCH